MLSKPLLLERAELAPLHEGDDICRTACHVDGAERDMCAQGGTEVGRNRKLIRQAGLRDVRCKEEWDVYAV